jgi:hypothetical protein
MAFLCAMFLAAPACAQGTAEISVGSVASVKAPASVTRGGRTASLKRGDYIHPNDTLTTGIGGSLGITFDDETTFTLGANARITIDEFVYRRGGANNSAAISVLRGTTAFFASQVAKTGNMTIGTPVATLGIRGTTGVIDVPDGSRPGAQVSVKLYPDANGAVGRIEVFDRAGAALGTLTRGTTGLAIAREAARFVGIPLTISAQQAALDRGLVQRLFSVQNLGRQLLEQRLLRIPDLRQKLNLDDVPGVRELRNIERDIRQQAPRLQRGGGPSTPSIPTLPSIPTPRIPNLPNIR